MVHITSAFAILEVSAKQLSKAKDDGLGTSRPVFGLL